jgi:hypothetical protein
VNALDVAAQPQAAHFRDPATPESDPTAPKNGRYLNTSISEIGSSAFARKSLKMKIGGIQ